MRSVSVQDSGPGTWFMQTLEDTLDSSQPEPAKPDNCVSNRKPWNNCLFNFSDCIGSLTGPGSAGVTEREAAWCHTRHWGYQDLHSQTHHQGEDSALTCSPHGARAWDWTNNNILTCVTLNVEMITGIVRECGDIFSCGPLLAVTISPVSGHQAAPGSPGYDAGDINEEMWRRVAGSYQGGAPWCCQRSPGVNIPTLELTRVRPAGDRCTTCVHYRWSHSGLIWCWRSHTTEVTQTIPASRAPKGWTRTSCPVEFPGIAGTEIWSRLRSSDEASLLSLW